jgi:hypothetical protein
MKNLFLSFIFLFCLTSTFAQTNFGYSTNPPASSSSSTGNSHSANNLLGHKINIPTDATITDIGIIAVNAIPTSNTIVAIYTDDGDDNPDTLIASTSSFSLTLGVNNIPLISPILLPAGDYWLMKNLSVNTDLGNNSEVNRTIRYINTPFGDPLPDPFPSSETFSGPTYSIYMISAIMTTTVPIPTMSQWGLLIFGLLIMNLSVFFVQKRELI